MILHNNGTSHSNKDSACYQNTDSLHAVLYCTVLYCTVLYHLVWADARVRAGQVHAEAPGVGGAGVEGVPGARPPRVARPGLRVQLLVAVAVLPVQPPAAGRCTL